MLWHKYKADCPKCGNEFSILEFAYSADSQYRFTLGCEKCGMTVQWLPFASQFQQMAQEADFQYMLGESKKPKPGAPLVPPISIQPHAESIQEMTDEDKKFLKDSGIDPEVP